MSQSSIGSLSPIICQKGELYNLTFGEDCGIPDSYRYFSQDIGSQTDEKDVVQVIELSNALKILTLENVDLKRTLGLTRSSLQSEFFRRLTNASNELYSRMNQRLEDIERSQRDRVEVVRRAFRTQLSDALSQMAAIYNEKMKRKLNHDRTYMESEESVKYTKKIAELTTKLKKYENKIKELERQITDIQENALEPEPTMILDSDSDVSEIIVEEDRLTPVESEVDDTLRENELKQNEYIEQLVKRIEVLEKQNNTYQREINQLEKETERLNAELISATGTVEVLKSQKQIIEDEMNQIENQHSQRVLDLEMMVLSEKNKVPIVKEEPIVQKPVSRSIDVQKNMKEFPDMSKEVAGMKKIIKEMTEKEGELTHEIDKIKGKFIDESKGYFEQIKVLQSLIDKLRAEMFTRHQIQSNFKQLHSASVKYAKSNHPIGILPSQFGEKESFPSRSTHYNANMSIIKEESPSIPNIVDTSMLKNFVEINI